MPAAAQADAMHSHDGFTDCAQDIVRAGRASIVQELENIFKVRKRAFAIADLHASPWRFQNAVACSSDANAPRRASAIAVCSASLNS